MDVDEFASMNHFYAIQKRGECIYTIATRLVLLSLGKLYLLVVVLAYPVALILSLALIIFNSENFRDYVPTLICNKYHDFRYRQKEIIGNKGIMP